MSEPVNINGLSVADAVSLAQTTPVTTGTNPTAAELDASKLTVNLTAHPKKVPSLDDPIRQSWSFCTDHMVTAVWTAEKGWAAPELRAYGPLSIMPNASVLHYATECFEGMKAFRGYDGKLRLFRPDCNARRMLASAQRISLPSFDVDAFEKLVYALMEVDGPKFLPRDQPGKFLYLRPTLIGTHNGLGIQAPREALLYIIACYISDPSASPTGLRLVASSIGEVRAWPGGHGFAKVGANYGPTLQATQVAREKGYEQVLWLFGPEGRVTEAGGSNFIIVWKSPSTGQLQLQTAPLTDRMTLDGVFRRSILALAHERLSGNEFGLEPVQIVEEPFTMDDVVTAHKQGNIVDVFTCGTAYFVSPISEINYKGESLIMPMGERGHGAAYAEMFKSWLADIIYGNDPQHPWAPIVNERGMY